MDHSNEVNIIELQNNVGQEVPDDTDDHDQIDAMLEAPGEDDDDDEVSLKTFAEIFNLHLKNFMEIPKVDHTTKEKITVSSAFGKGFLAAILCAVR